MIHHTSHHFCLRTVQVWETATKAQFESVYTRGDLVSCSGQYGSIYRCTRNLDGKLFAVKEVCKGRMHRIPMKLRCRFLSLMQTELDVMMVLVDHPGVFPLGNYFEDHYQLRLVLGKEMEHTLWDYIIRFGRIGESDCAGIATQLLSSLQYMSECHEIPHGDLSPSRIAIQMHSDRHPTVKIMDFGLTQVLSRVKFLSHLIETPYFTAPEIIASRTLEQRLSYSADVWAIGVLLYLLLFGYPPFYVDPERYIGKRERQATYRRILQGFQPIVLDTEVHGYGAWFPSHIPVSAACRDLLSKLLMKDPSKRLTAGESLLHPWLTHRGIITDDEFIAQPQQSDRSGRSGSSGSSGSSSSRMRRKQSSPLIRPSGGRMTTKKKRLITRIDKFIKCHLFKTAVLSCLCDESANIRIGDWLELDRLLLSSDLDGDGIITYDEFVTALSNWSALRKNEERMRDLFENGDCKVSEMMMSDMDGVKYAEWLSAMVHDYVVCSECRLYRAFCEADDQSGPSSSSREGCLSMDVFLSVYEKGDCLNSMNRGLSIARSLERSEDGMIDYEQFLLALLPDFESLPEPWMTDLFRLSYLVKERSLKDTHSRLVSLLGLSSDW